MSKRKVFGRGFNSRRLHQFYSIKSTCCKTCHIQICVLPHNSPTFCRKPIKTASWSPGAAFDFNHQHRQQFTKWNILPITPTHSTSIIRLLLDVQNLKNCRWWPYKTLAGFHNLKIKTMSHVIRTFGTSQNLKIKTQPHLEAGRFRWLCILNALWFLGIMIMGVFNSPLIINIFNFVNVFIHFQFVFSEMI